jgi:hypothetical protein
MKAAPPFSPVVVGKRHILPRPTAEPAVASIRPVREAKFAIKKYVYYNAKLQLFSYSQQ